MKNKEKESYLTISGELGEIVISPSVIQEITKDILKEIPGIEELRLNLLSKKTDSGKVSVLPADDSNNITLVVGVCLNGHVPVKTVAVQIQERLMHELPKMVGIKVEKVVVKVEKIIL